MLLTNEYREVLLRSKKMTRKSNKTAAQASANARRAATTNKTAKKSKAVGKSDKAEESGNREEKSSTGFGEEEMNEHEKTAADVNESEKENETDEGEDSRDALKRKLEDMERELAIARSCLQSKKAQQGIVALGEDSSENKSSSATNGDKCDESALENDEKEGKKPDKKGQVKEKELKQGDYNLIKTVIKNKLFAWIKFARDLDLREKAREIGMNDCRMSERRMETYAKSIERQILKETTSLRCGYLRAFRLRFQGKIIRRA